jgi:hypothetical protein
MIVAHARSSCILKAVCIVLHVAALLQQAAAALSLTDCVSSAAITIEYNSVYVVQEDASVVQIAYINGQTKSTAIDLGGADKIALAVASCDDSTCILTGNIITAVLRLSRSLLRYRISARLLTLLPCASLRSPRRGSYHV